MNNEYKIHCALCLANLIPDELINKEGLSVCPNCGFHIMQSGWTFKRTQSPHNLETYYELDEVLNEDEQEKD